MFCLRIFICTEYKTRAFSALLEMLRWFAGQQIRNTAVRSQPLLKYPWTIPPPSVHCRVLEETFAMQVPFQTSTQFWWLVEPNYTSLHKVSAPLLHDCVATLLANTWLGSKRVITLDSNFFLDYKKTCIKPNEVLVAILIPFTAQVGTFTYTVSAGVLKVSFIVEWVCV